MTNHPNPNSAAQAAIPQTVLSFDERERILCQFMGEPINHDREMAIAIESAVLSKLRAPAADSFESWWSAQAAANGGNDIGADYRHWANKALLASAPVAGEATDTFRNLLLEAVHRYGNARALAEHDIKQRGQISTTVAAILDLLDAAPQASAEQMQAALQKSFDMGKFYGSLPETDTEDVRNAALEEAAVLVGGHTWAGASKIVSDLIAEHIRALKQPQAERDGGQQRARDGRSRDDHRH